MKKFLALAAVFGVTLFAANKIMAHNRAQKSEVSDESDDSDDNGQEDLKSRFEELGSTLKDKIAKAEEDLKDLADDKKAEARKGIDALKRQANDIQKGSEKAGEEIRDDWDTVKSELSDLADKVEDSLKK